MLTFNVRLPLQIYIFAENDSISNLEIDKIENLDLKVKCKYDCFEKKGLHFIHSNARSIVNQIF